MILMILILIAIGLNGTRCVVMHSKKLQITYVEEPVVDGPNMLQLKSGPI